MKISAHGTPLTPRAHRKQEFGRQLQQLLDERNWSQADLVRAVETATGEKMGRDAVSTYINGRSFPTPASLNLLCKALGRSRGELFPSAIMNATNDEDPTLVIRQEPGQTGEAWVRLDRLLPLETAMEIFSLVNAADKRAAATE